ncbi:adenosylcobinamide-GDP ribazoletransferase [Duganella callida]|uniref:Adenosylcobinamide-GDP ribazoletransferase n=1 Tax=Duganella callida TaxID=2561932 RepID=A0A4Y9SL05_9BURK|nr:adenosylcobinamide-GDP ribazoletransferase [Duganella callida]TFW27372.1 adenosylcobinamide-GDP ribazoletransferase [Duganella callida]
MHQVRLFFTALQFFTRLPIPGWVGFDPAWLNQAARYFPLVGVVVALITGASYALAAWFLPEAAAAVISTAVGIYITGAFHEDGFADMCDGFGGGMTQARILEIMKDSRIGAYGAIGMVCMLALKLTTLSMLPPLAAIGALLTAHPLSRLMATTLIWRLDYARAEGKAKPLAQQINTSEFLIAAFTAMLPALLVAWLHWLPSHALVYGVIAMATATLWLARLFVRRIGGYTGDCLGAVQQVTEVLLYVAVLASFQHGALSAWS